MTTGTPPSPRFPRLERALSSYFRIEHILYAFWLMFWTLNGLDKFFNAAVAESPVFEGVMRPRGWFGVNRDAKFIEYFDRLGLPPEAAIANLYTFGFIEVLLGAVFGLILVRVFRAARRGDARPMLLTRFALKMNMLVFFCFCTGDILFGDRMELWEHGTFMILTLMTYQLYLRRADEYADVLGRQLAAADTNRDGRIDTGEYNRFMARESAPSDSADG